MTKLSVFTRQKVLPKATDPVERRARDEKVGRVQPVNVSILPNIVELMPSTLDPARRFRNFRFATSRARVGRLDHIDSRLKVVVRNLTVGVDKTQLDTAVMSRTEVSSCTNGHGG